MNRTRIIIVDGIEIHTSLSATEIAEDAFIETEWFVSILDKMQELEKGCDSHV